MMDKNLTYPTVEWVFVHVDGHTIKPPNIDHIKARAIWGLAGQESGFIHKHMIRTWRSVYGSWFYNQ